MLGKKALTLIAQHILPCFPCQVVWRKHVVITLTEIPYWLQDLPTPEKAKPALGYSYIQNCKGSKIFRNILLSKNICKNGNQYHLRFGKLLKCLLPKFLLQFPKLYLQGPV